MRTFDEIRELLSQKFSKEKLRLKSYGTKASSFDLAHAVARHVQSLMAESRYSELKRLKKVLDKQPSQGDLHKIWEHYRERSRATKAMAQAIQNVADQNEKARPWKRKPEHKKKKHHHGHRRSHGKDHK